MFYTFRLFGFLFVCMFAFQASVGQVHTIEFTGNGILTAPPPEIVKAGEKLIFKLNLSNSYIDKRAKEYIELYLTAMENITFGKTYAYIDENPQELFKVRCALGKEIVSLSSYLSIEDQAIVKQRTGYLRYQDICSTDKTVPVLTASIKPSFTLDIIFYSHQGHEVGRVEAEPLTVIDPTAIKDIKLKTKEMVVPDGAETIKYELREKNVINLEIQKQLQTVGIDSQRAAIVTALDGIKDMMNPEFTSELSALKARVDQAKKYFENSAANPITPNWLTASNTLLAAVDGKVNSMLVLLQNNQVRSWMLNWMWLSKGLPATNPFDFQAQLLFPGTSVAMGKVTEKEKALVETFDALVAKEAFKLTSLSPTLDKDLDAIAGIKARLKAEGAAGSVNNNSDIYWYSGTIKVTNEESKSYMISHDAANQYMLMTKPLEEVTEDDRVFIFTQNKKAGDPTRIEVTPTAITSDIGKTTEELRLSAVLSDLGTPRGILGQVVDFLNAYIVLNRKIEFIESLKTAPKLPVLFTKSTTPVYQAEPLIYNTVFDAPQRIDYTLTTGPTDKPVQVFKGDFRVNRLYHLRFKAGMVYSWLKTEDYTKNADNSFSVIEDRAGIDGVFGVQIFPWKIDIRDVNNSKWKNRLFVYAGFSMKNITQNFYPGAGFEIFSGVSLAYILHVGKTEVLAGTSNMASQIENKWVTGSGVSILVDGEFFVNLFRFGSNKSLFQL